MLMQPSGILPVWVEDGGFLPFVFMESPEQGDWVLNVATSGNVGTEGVPAGRVRFCHHQNSDRVRAQCFYMFGNAEPFLWRMWFADTDGQCSDFEWFVRFGSKWWWVPLCGFCGDAESPHTIRFQVMVEKAAHEGLPWHAKKVFIIVLNNHGKPLYREVFTNPGLA